MQGIFKIYNKKYELGLIITMKLNRFIMIININAKMTHLPKAYFKRIFLLKKLGCDG